MLTKIETSEKIPKHKKFFSHKTRFLETILGNSRNGHFKMSKSDFRKYFWELTIFWNFIERASPAGARSRFLYECEHI